MKKFFLYFLLILFIAGLASLAYGFWNAKNIRHWANASAEIKARNDISGREKNIEDKMNASGGKRAEEFNAELAGFASDLDVISKDLNLAGEETGNLSAPRSAKTTRTELAGFYQKSGEQVQNIANVAKFMNQVFDVTVIFDRMSPDTTAQEIRDMIDEAKTKSAKIDTGVLPAEMRGSGNDLKVASDNYLDQFGQFAAGKVENHDQLNASYDNFSGKVNDFLLTKKNYFETFENLDLTEKKIDSELMVLERVKFTIK